MVPVTASMGPQLYRCGNLCRYALPFPDDPCFNGAATLSLRKPFMGLVNGVTEVVLQWGRNFIVAETWSSSSPAVFLGRLQWGRNFIVAETRLFRLTLLSYGAASMGPQLYRCGNLSLIKESMSIYISFNGAATLSLRKPAAIRPPFMPPVKLQWGRNFIVAETRNLSIHSLLIG